jgi:hypothetical protein
MTKVHLSKIYWKKKEATLRLLYHNDCFLLIVDAMYYFCLYIGAP